MIPLYQFKHGPAAHKDIMLKNIPIYYQGKLAVMLDGYNNLIGGMVVSNLFLHDKL